MDTLNQSPNPVKEIVAEPSEPSEPTPLEAGPKLRQQTLTEKQRLAHRAADAKWRNANREVRRAAQRTKRYRFKVKIARILRKAREVQS
jgi:hypothetical protein